MLQGIPEFFEVGDTPELITTEFLQSVGLAINTALDLLICLPCGLAQTTTSLAGHLRRAHGKAYAEKSVELRVLEVAEYANVSSMFPEIVNSREPRNMFAGIKVNRVYGCPHCPYAATIKKVQEHAKKMHKGSNEKMEENVATQILNTAVTRSHIRVKEVEMEVLDVSAANNVVDEFNSFDWKEEMKERLVPNARMVSPWLMRTGWHKHVEGKDVAALCQLVALPEANEFPGLQQAVLKYFEQATDLLEETDELVLQRLNSADPTKK